MSGPQIRHRPLLRSDAVALRDTRLSVVPGVLPPASKQVYHWFPLLSFSPALTGIESQILRNPQHASGFPSISELSSRVFRNPGLERNTAISSPWYDDDDHDMLNRLIPEFVRHRCRSPITGSLDPRITGTPDHRITGSPYHRIPGSPDPRIPGSPDPRITGSPDHRIPRSPDPRIPGSPDNRITGSPDFRGPEIACRRSNGACHISLARVHLQVTSSCNDSHGAAATGAANSKGSVAQLPLR